MAASTRSARRTSPPRGLALLLLLAFVGLAAAIPEAGESEPEPAPREPGQRIKLEPEEAAAAAAGVAEEAPTEGAPGAPHRRGDCDAAHCDGCATTDACAAVPECIWHPHEVICRAAVPPAPPARPFPLLGPRSGWRPATVPSMSPAHAHAPAPAFLSQDYCHVREIMLFGHKIDLVKLHDQKGERAEP